MVEMSTWEVVLLGAMGVMIFFFMRPNLKARLEQSKQATGQDWKAFLLPLALVVAFVVLLIAAV